MKKYLAMILSFCMLISVIPVFATSAEDTNQSFCKILFEEDFEGENSITMSESSTAVGTVQAVAETEGYGQGTQNYAITNSSTSPYGMLVFDPVNKLTESLRGGVHTAESETYGYTVELSADWNPTDENASGPTTRIGIHGRETKDEDFGIGMFMGLTYKGGDKETSVRTINILNRKQETVKTIDLTQVLGDEIWDSSHVYRLRFVIKPYAELQTVTEGEGEDATETKYAGTIDIYMDGVKIDTFEYLDNTKETHIYGLLYRSSKDAAGTLDNIKMTAYWDGMTGETEGAVSYINDDALITAIRRCESKLSGLDADKQAILSDAIATAKATYTATDRTQASVDSTMVALEAVEVEVSKAYQYKVLHSENFEDATAGVFTPYGGVAEYNESKIESVDGTKDSNYALDGNWNLLDTTEDEKYGVVYQFASSSGSIRGDAINIANHYKTELSFDYKMPEDIVSRILVNTNNNVGEFVKGGKICFIELNPTTGVATFYDRNDYAMATIKLSDYVAGADFTKEVNRFRLVFAPEEDGSVVRGEDTRTTAGTVTLFINGIKACEEKYVKNNKESAIAGMIVKSSTSNAGKVLGYIDNIELISYDDLTLAAANAVAYLNKDKLVSAIRGAAIVKDNAEKYNVELPDGLEASLSAAKAAYVSESATTTSMNDAADTLNAFLGTAKKGIYSQELVKDFSWVPNVAESSEREKAQNSIYGDLYLPSNYLAGDRDLDITWESDNPGVIDAAGYVSGPMVNTYVNLKAIFTDGTDNSIYAERTFKTRVLAGGSVLFNQNVSGVDESPQKTFKPSKEMFMLTASGKAGDYVFTLGGKDVIYTFTQDGDYDVIYDKSNDTYTIYQNCIQVETGSIELGNVSIAKVSGKEITKFIGIDLNIDKALITSYSYQDGPYQLGVPTPGSELTGITLKARDDIDDATVYVAVYTESGLLYDSAATTVNADAGDTVPITFADSVKLPDGADFDSASLKVFLWNAQLAPMMEPVVYPVLGDVYEDRATIYMIGDSTMCNYSASYYPRAGWGQMLGNYFDETKVVVDNRAVSGRTTKWFKDKGEFDKILATIKPGDYLMMQFGHNDQKEKANISIADYKANLKYFVDSVKAKGATPIICSSITRRNYNETGAYDPTIGSLGEYPAAAMATAMELNVTGLDLYSYSKQVLGALTDDTSKQLYCHVPATYPGYDPAKLDKYVDGAADNTHFSEYGAHVWAKEAARLIGETTLPIAAFVKNVD